jgi:hypothetical protein
MKVRRALGTILALALVAIAATASPAAAKPTALCVVNEDPCAAKNIKSESLYGFFGPITENPTEGKWTSSMGTLSCKEGKLVTDFTTGKGEPIVGKTWFYLFTCLYLGSKCSVEPEALNYFGTVEALTKGDGLLTVGKPVFVLSCEFGKCKYTTLGLKSEIKGGNPAMLSVNAPLEKLAGGIQCPTTFTYVGLLEDQAPTATFITHA